MNIYVQFDIRSWWIGFYLNTLKRELHICLFPVVINIPFRRQQTENKEVDF